MYIKELFNIKNCFNLFKNININNKISGLKNIILVELDEYKSNRNDNEYF